MALPLSGPCLPIRREPRGGTDAHGTPDSPGTTGLWFKNVAVGTDVKNRLLDSVGAGEGGMIGQNSIGTCILSYVK